MSELQPVTKCEFGAIFLKIPVLKSGIEKAVKKPYLKDLSEKFAKRGVTLGVFGVAKLNLDCCIKKIHRTTKTFFGIVQ